MYQKMGGGERTFEQLCVLGIQVFIVIKKERKKKEHQVTALNEFINNTKGGLLHKF